MKTYGKGNGQGDQIAYAPIRAAQWPRVAEIGCKLIGSRATRNPRFSVLALACAILGAGGGVGRRQHRAHCPAWYRARRSGRNRL